MSKYLVLKRMKEDRVYLPSEIVDEDELGGAAAILMERGFIQPVPDNFSAPTARGVGRAGVADRQGDTAASSSSDDNSGGSSTSDDGDSGDLTVEELTALTRDELNKMAATVGIENANELPNKLAVANAILEANTLVEDDEDDGEEGSTVAGDATEGGSGD